MVLLAETQKVEIQFLILVAVKVQQCTLQQVVEEQGEMQQILEVREDQAEADREVQEDQEQDICRAPAGGAASGTSGGPSVEPTLFPGAPKCQGGPGGASGSSGVANSGQGGDGHSTGSPGGNGGSGVVRVKAPAQPFSFYGSGVWDMNAVYDYVKAGEWS